jgi:hypothetical protein
VIVNYGPEQRNLAIAGSAKYCDRLSMRLYGGLRDYILSMDNLSQINPEKTQKAFFFTNFLRPNNGVNLNQPGNNSSSKVIWLLTIFEINIFFRVRFGVNFFVSSNTVSAVKNKNSS